MTVRPEDLPGLLLPAANGPQLDWRFGTVASGYVSGRPAVIWDGETEASTRTYPMAKGLALTAGDRVAALVQGTRVIIICAIE